MRILHLCLKYTPAIGGAERYCERLATAFAARGHQVEVLTSNLIEHVRFKRLPASVPRVEVVSGVRIVRCPSINIPGNVYPVMLSMPWHLLRLRPDIIHAHCWGYFTVDLPAVLRRWLGVPVIIKPWIPPGDRHHGWSRTFLDRLSARVDAIIVASSFERDAILARGLKPRRMVEIPPAIDQRPYRNARRDRFRRMGWGDDPVVLFVGRLAEGKGIDLILKSAGSLKGKVDRFRIAFVGPDYGLRDWIQAEAKRLVIDDRVAVFDPPKDEDLPDFYRSATCFCFPSQYEVFGLVLIEAMAAGLPIVSSNNAAIPTVIENGRTGLLVRSGEPGELAEALARLLGDAELRTSLAKAGLDEVEKRYREDRVLDQTEQLYLELRGQYTGV
jgi:glycosyltransferase involved in cell wall biosynthesis